jgi:hypothetical protein
MIVEADFPPKPVRADPAREFVIRVWFDGDFLINRDFPFGFIFMVRRDGFLNGLFPTADWQAFSGLKCRFY